MCRDVWQKGWGCRDICPKEKLRKRSGKEPEAKRKQVLGEENKGDETEEIPEFPIFHHFIPIAELFRGKE
jgi:hypothetical protein